MDGQKSLTGAQAAPIKPHAQATETTGSEEGRHSSRLNRLVKFIRNVMKKLPGLSSQRTLASKPLQQRQIVIVGQAKPEHPVSQGSTHDHTELFKLQELQVNSARSVLNEEAEKAQSEGRDEDENSLLKLHSQQLQNELQRMKKTVEWKGTEPVTREEMYQAKHDFPVRLQNILVSAGIDEQSVDKRFRAAYVQELNSRPWQTIEKSFELNGRVFESRQQPATEIRVPDSLQGEVARLFDKDYEGKGVSCMDTANAEHATNLNRSDFSINGRAVYTGIRHGIADPYGVKGDPELKVDGGKARVREILLSALATRPDLFEQALAAGDGRGPVPTLTTISTSLVTTGLGSGKERKMQKAQNKAFEYFTDPARQPVTLELPGPDGQPKKITLKFEQARFNIPVNWGGVGGASLVTGGRKLQKAMNDPAMAMLVGKPNRSANPGGLAKKFLSASSSKMAAVRAQIEQAKSAGDVEKTSELTAELNQLTRDYRSVLDLTRQIQDIYRKGRHHHHHHDAYKLAARVTLLTHIVGAVPLSNCKSGKDRTGMLDGEVKFLAARIDPDTGAVPEPGRILKPEDRALFQKILQESGNLEIQEQNVGVRGYKTEGVKSISERIGNPELRAEIRGLSKTVGS